MKKKISLFGLMLVMLFAVATPFAYAISTIDVDTFKEKLEDLGYEVDDYDTSAYASKDGISITYKKYDSEKDAKEELADACEEIDEVRDKGGEYIEVSSYSKSNCKKDTKASKGYVKYSAKILGKSGYAIAYRKGDTVISASGDEDDKDEIIKAMKKLGYYSSNTWVVVVVILVLVGGGVAVFVITKNKNKSSMMYNNGMMNQPQNNMFGGPTNNQPQNNMFGGPTNNQPQNNMFGEPTNNQPQNDMFSGQVNNQPQDFWNQQVKSNDMFNDQNNQQ